MEGERAGRLGYEVGGNVRYELCRCACGYNRVVPSHGSWFVLSPCSHERALKHCVSHYSRWQAQEKSKNRRASMIRRQQWKMYINHRSDSTLNQNCIYIILIGYNSVVRLRPRIVSSTRCWQTNLLGCLQKDIPIVPHGPLSTAKTGRRGPGLLTALSKDNYF